tara:strand:+ start:215 stop:439 length:225 start_codon:yes stop_codon:yes gene_type:complete
VLRVAVLREVLRALESRPDWLSTSLRFDLQDSSQASTERDVFERVVLATSVLYLLLHFFNNIYFLDCMKKFNSK